MPGGSLDRILGERGNELIHDHIDELQIMAAVKEKRLFLIRTSAMSCKRYPGCSRRRVGCRSYTSTKWVIPLLNIKQASSLDSAP